MPYTSDYFDDITARLGHAIPVSDLIFPTNIRIWRLLVVIRLSVQLLFAFLFLYWPFLLWWAMWRLLCVIVRKVLPAGQGQQGIFAMGNPGHEIILRLWLDASAKSNTWKSFWTSYFLCGNVAAFHENYLEAWRQRYEEEQRQLVPPRSECSITMFKDNGDMQEIPCRWDMTDAEFFRHVGRFYYLLKAEQGLVAGFGFKVLHRIEAVKLENKTAAGERVFDLKLGRYKFENRLIHFFRNPALLQGSDIIQDLVVRKALAEPGQHKLGLNMVSSWSTRTASSVVAAPLMLSLVVSIVWSIVAVRKFEADVQASVQTGFTIGSYIVTAGALLIALIAFLDSVVSRH